VISNMPAKLAILDKTTIARPGFEPVDTNCSYTLQHFMVITGLGVAGIRKAKRRGLKILVVGRRRYVRGVDWASFLEELANEPT
jgi:hypothetical protein